MHDEATTQEPGGGPRVGVTAAILGGGVGLILAANRVGRALMAAGHRMKVYAPPLTGNVDPRVTAMSAVVVMIGTLAVWRAERAARTLPWRTLLWAAFAGALVWAAALAWWDGAAGFTTSGLAPVSYLRAVPMVGSPGAFLHGFFTQLSRLPAHVQVHPPGFVLLLWGMDRIGLGGAGWLAALELLGGAAAVPATLIAVRELVGEDLARAAAPFLVFAPMAVFWSSADAFFLGVSVWAVALLIRSLGPGGRRSFVIAGGMLAGAALMLSYALVAIAAIPLAVAISRRRFRPLLVAGLIAVCVPLAFAASGWSWIQGLVAARGAYGRSIATLRPYGYFLGANVAALAIALGPAVWVGLHRLRDRRVWLVTGAALAVLALMDLSGLTKAEVERIWLPFMPWIVAGAGVAFARTTNRSRQSWLALQVLWAIGIQFLVRSPW